MSVYGVTTRWRFSCVHQLLAHRSGQECTVVRTMDAGMWKIVVRFDDGAEMVALPSELVTLSHGR